MEPDRAMWRAFTEYCYYEQKSGGPDPHMNTMRWMAHAMMESEVDLAWAAGLYVGTYNVASAEKLLQALPHRAAVAMSTGELASFLNDRWEGIHLHRYRRSARSPEKMGRYLRDLAQFVDGEPWEHWESYQEAWDSVGSLYTMGRYTTMKLIEALRRFIDPERLPAQPDMRPRDGWSPRACLALLFPAYAEVLEREDKESWALTDRLGLELAAALNMTPYVTQVLLCDAKQMIKTGKQFPGKPLDNDLGFGRAVESFWNTETLLWEARKQLFPEVTLGEVQGWEAGDRKKPLGALYVKTGIVWSDLKYDWLRSEQDLAHPVRRS